MPYPQLRLADTAATRLRHHDAWVFRDELIKPDAALPDGDTVELIDRDGAFVAYAWYSQHSRVAARALTTDARYRIDRAWLAQRLDAAIRRRRAITGTNAKRIVFSEADGLPGLIVDQYADYLVIQSRTAAMDRVKPSMVDLLKERLKPQGILERSDKAFRDEEGLPQSTAVLHGQVPERIEIHEDALRFLVDPHGGHKTGFYLDQRDARRRLRGLVQKDEQVADVFAYTGAFGLVAASAGARAVCVERDEPALELAKENAKLNRLESRMEFVAGDAFYWLEAKERSGERFDWVLLDPPALAKSKTEAPKARHDLHRLVKPALGLLKPEGALALSVCTYHVLDVAEEVLRMSAADQGMRLRMLGTTQQAEDHPWILQMPMTRYLMGWLARRDGSSAASPTSKSR